MTIINPDRGLLSVLLPGKLECSGRDSVTVLPPPQQSAALAATQATTVATTANHGDMVKSKESGLKWYR